MRALFLVSILYVFLFTSCSSCKDRQNTNTFDPFVWPNREVVTDESSGEDNSIVVIPFEIRSGVKYIPVKINGGPTFEMIFDTGCSETLISIKEAQYLEQADLLSKDDYHGSAQYSIADGSIVENTVVTLKELIIGGKIRCVDVKATVSNNIQAPMLLGNEVFDRMPSFTIDNENQVVKFNLR